VALCALALWIVNDHLLKGAGPGWLTGKLSDVAGLIFFPLLIAAVIEIGARIRHRHAIILGTLAFTFVLYVGINLIPAVDEFMEVVSGYCRWPLDALVRLVSAQPVKGPGPTDLTLDPSDLFLVPLLWLPYRIYRDWHSSKS
jgi:hypothetical protein